MKIVLLAIASSLSIALSGQSIVSRFTWDVIADGPLKADIGPDAVSVEGNTQVAAGGVGGTSGLVAPTDGEDTNLLLADDDIYDLESIDLSYDFQRNENEGSILVRGAFIFGTASFLQITYRVRNPDNTTETVTSGPVREVTRDDADPGDFHNYRFVYTPSTGVGQLYFDGALEYTYNSTVGAVLDWDPGSAFLFGPLIDGSKRGFPVFDNLVFAESESASLPVELEELTARRLLNGSVTLGWATYSETDNDRFEVDRRSHGRAWSTIGTVPGAGDSRSRQVYHLIDSDPQPGVNYYRLRQVDYDGSSFFSSIISVELSPDVDVAALMAYPNPSPGLVFLPLFDPGAKLGAVRVYDAGGRAISAPVRVERGGIQVDLTNYPAGVYTLRVGGERIRVVKQ